MHNHYRFLWLLLSLTLGLMTTTQAAIFIVTTGPAPDRAYPVCLIYTIEKNTSAGGVRLLTHPAEPAL